MKARFLALVALVLGMVSCQQDFVESNNSRGEVDFQLSVAAPEFTTRADGDNQRGHDSAYGAIDYFSTTDWDTVDLRYILEVYDADADFEDATLEPVKDRIVKYVDSYEPVKFDLRLIPNREYRFVVFADFVSEDEHAELHHQVGATLADIAVINDAINDECSDAYFAIYNTEINNSAAKNIELKRPYAKVRVIATDLAELNLNVDPTAVAVKYYATYPQSFNAVTGDIAAEVEQQYVLTGDYNDGVGKNSLATHFYTEGYDAEKDATTGRHTHMTLFTDYILAGEQQSPISFDMVVYSGSEVIKETKFETNIPVQRNHLTTIIGNVLTTATEINVTIDDNFVNADRQYYVFEALVNGGEVTLDRDYVIGRPLYVEAEATLNLNGHTITTAFENDETDAIIVHKEGKLTINGEGIIEAVTGTDGYAVIVRDNGELTINGGTFKAGVDTEGEANAVVYVRDNGKVFVNGGEFPNAAESNYVLNKRDADRATTTIEVRGGRFYKFDPANNLAENPQENFVAEGYLSLKDGDWFEVISCIVVRNAEEFTAAAANPNYKYMYIAGDIDFGTQYVVVGTPKVILGNGYKFIGGGKTTKNYALGVQSAIDVQINDLVLNGGGGIYVSAGANVEVNNVTLKVNYSASGRHMFYVSNATLTVNSGNYDVLRTGCKYFTLENNALVYVKGGTFEDMMAKDAEGPVRLNSGVLEISGGKFQVGTANYKFDPTPYLADGYKAERVGNYMEVSAL